MRDEWNIPDFHPVPVPKPTQIEEDDEPEYLEWNNKLLLAGIIVAAVAVFVETIRV